MPRPLQSMNDLPAPRPLLTLPWEAGVTGWIVVFGAVVAEIVAGSVTNRMPTAIAAPALAFPVVVAAGFAVVQWQQVRSSGAEPASWWHLAAIASAMFTWLVWPTAPGMLAPAASARSACIILVSQPTPECLSRAAHAMDNRNLVWWLTGALIVAAALAARRSRIAAWAAIPAALGGCTLATHFLELLLRQYHAGG
jgi:hypothetical protein